MLVRRRTHSLRHRQQCDKEMSTGGRGAIYGAMQHTAGAGPACAGAAGRGGRPALQGSQSSLVPGL